MKARQIVAIISTILLLSAILLWAVFPALFVNHGQIYQYYTFICITFGSSGYDEFYFRFSWLNFVAIALLITATIYKIISIFKTRRHRYNLTDVVVASTSILAGTILLFSVQFANASLMAHSYNTFMTNYLIGGLAILGGIIFSTVGSFKTTK